MLWDLQTAWAVFIRQLSLRVQHKTSKFHWFSITCIFPQNLNDWKPVKHIKKNWIVQGSQGIVGYTVLYCYTIHFECLKTNRTSIPHQSLLQACFCCCLHLSESWPKWSLQGGVAVTGGFFFLPVLLESTYNWPIAPPKKWLKITWKPQKHRGKRQTAIMEYGVLSCSIFLRTPIMLDPPCYKPSSMREQTLGIFGV